MRSRWVKPCQLPGLVTFVPNAETSPAHQVKASGTHDQAQCKLQISFNSKSDIDLSVIHESFIQTDANYKPCQGPMVHMEWILHTKLTQLEDAFMG